MLVVLNDRFKIAVTIFMSLPHYDCHMLLLSIFKAYFLTNFPIWDVNVIYTITEKIQEVFCYYLTHRTRTSIEKGFVAEKFSHFLLSRVYIRTFTRASLRFPKGCSHFMTCSVSIFIFELVTGVSADYFGVSIDFEKVNAYWVLGLVGPSETFKLRGKRFIMHFLRNYHD